MAESYRGVVLMIALVVATALRLTSAASPGAYTVGDSTGWTVPGDGAVTYQAWAKKHNFLVGDILVFNFINGTHNVAAVTKTAHDTCNAATTQSLFDSAPVRITLTAPGQHYFICTFPGHCSMGQRLAIDVATTTPPPSSPTTQPPSSPATPPSSTPAASPRSSQGTPPTSSPSAPTASPSSSPTVAPISTPITTPPSSSIAGPPSIMATPTPSSSTAFPPSTGAAPSPTEAAQPPTPGNSAVRLVMAGTVAVMFNVVLAFV